MLLNKPSKNGVEELKLDICFSGQMGNWCEGIPVETVDAIRVARQDSCKTLGKTHASMLFSWKLVAPQPKLCEATWSYAYVMQLWIIKKGVGDFRWSQDSKIICENNEANKS